MSDFRRQSDFKQSHENLFRHMPYFSLDLFLYLTCIMYQFAVVCFNLILRTTHISKQS